MEDVFGNDTTPVNESPADAGQEEEAAVNPEQEVEDLDEQDLEQEDGASPEDAGQDEELLAGKFKTPAELAKSYLELQKKFTQTAQQVKQQPNQQVPEQQAGNADLEEVFWNEFQNNPLRTMQYLIDNVVAAKTAPITAREQESELGRLMDPIAKEFKQVRSEEGMTALFEKIGEIALEMGNPQLAQHPNQRLMRMAAQELYGDGKAALIASARDAGREEADATRRNKQSVNVNTSGKKAPQAAPKSAAESIQEGILSSGKNSSIFG